MPSRGASLLLHARCSVGWRRRELPSMLSAMTHGSGRQNCISPTPRSRLPKSRTCSGTLSRRVFTARSDDGTAQHLRRFVGTFDERPHDLVFGVTSIPLLPV